MKKKFRFGKIMWLITYTILLIFAMMNIGYLFSFLKGVYKILMPFVYGFILAYILNFPFSFFQNKCFAKIGTKHKRFEGLRKTLSLLCSYILVLGIIAFLVGILVPQLTENVKRLVDDIPTYAANIQSFFDSVVATIDKNFGYNLYDGETFNNLVNFLVGSNSQQFLTDFMMNALPAAIDFAETFTTGLYNWIIGIIVSVYMLSNKERLCYQMRAMTVAYLPLKTSKKVLRITDLCNKKCGRFIIGNILVSLLVGIVCFIGLSIFKFDYPLLISVVVGITNIIPFFGPIIGAVPCALLLLLIDPIQCFWFVVFIVILQQIDGNIITPKILGETIGISGFWVLFSVILGGGLFGLPGMLLGVPVFAVIYTLMDEGVTKRLKTKRELLGKSDKSNEAAEVESENIKESDSDKIIIKQED